MVFNIDVSKKKEDKKRRKFLFFVCLGIETLVVKSFPYTVLYLVLLDFQTEYTGFSKLKKKIKSHKTYFINPRHLLSFTTRY